METGSLPHRLAVRGPVGARVGAPVPRAVRFPAMKRTLFLLVACVTALAGQITRAQDFTPLFDSRSLAGWVEMGEKNAWVAADGVLTLKNPRNYPNWLRSEKQDQNFVFRMDYRMSA